MRLLTFDIEDYHHLLDIHGLNEQYDVGKSIVESETLRILKMLKTHRVRAIFFVLGEVAVRFPNVVKAIASDGHVLGTHSHKHDLHKDLSDKEFVDDLRKSIQAIERVSGQKVRCYRAPGFSLQKEQFNRFELMRAEGIEYDFSLFDGDASHGGVGIDKSQTIPFTFNTSSGEIKSFPFVKTKVACASLPILGGGYFRLTPKWLIRRALRRDGYMMTYFHPRDFAILQPRLKGLSFIRYFKAYVGLSGAFDKLETLVASTDWSDVEIFNV